LTDTALVRHSTAAAEFIPGRCFAADGHPVAVYLARCLRGVLKECWRLEYVSAADYHRAIDFRVVPGETLVRGRARARGELRTIFSACASDTAPAGVRDAALLAGG